jgi:hypothetical protein
MADRRVVPAALAVTLSALVFFGLGSYLGARPSDDGAEALAALRAEVDLLRRRDTIATAGTSGRIGSALDALAPAARAELIDDVKRSSRPRWGCCP